VKPKESSEEDLLYALAKILDKGRDIHILVPDNFSLVSLKDLKVFSFKRPQLASGCRIHSRKPFLKIPMASNPPKNSASNPPKNSNSQLTP
jgi:hypothetical protein